MKENYIEKKYDEIIKCRLWSEKEYYAIPMRIIKQIISDTKNAIKSEFRKHDFERTDLYEIDDIIQNAEVK